MFLSFFNWSDLLQIQFPSLIYVVQRSKSIGDDYFGQMAAENTRFE